MLNWNEIDHYRENNRVEAKSAVGGLPKNLWETYSAFANSMGGLILLGVEEREDKTFRAVALPDPEKIVTDFWNTVNNRQKVNVNILSDKNVKIVEADDNRIVVIEIARADRRDRPVYVGVDPFTGSYRRNGEGDYHCTRDEVRNMMRDQSDVSQDSRILDQLDLDAFDYESIKRYRTRLQNIRPDHVWENLEPVTFMQKLGCVGRAEDGTLHPTVAGVLMFGYEYEIIKEFPGFFLDYQEHDNESMRWTDRVVSNLGDWSGNIFDFYFRVCNRISQDAKTPFELNGVMRVDDTPVHKAMREALANALIHANYYDRLGLVIHRRPHIITIANPGNLRISIDDAVSGLSDPRNYALVKLFNLIGIGERAGSGIPSIYSVWKSQGWKEPVLEEQFNPDRTILSLVLSKTSDKKRAIKTSDNSKSTKGADRKQAILDYLSIHQTVKTSAIAGHIGISPGRARVYLQELVVDGVIIAEGANRNKTFRIK